MKHNKAEEENSLLIFLVECCDEAPGLEVTGKDVADAYVKFYQAALEKVGRLTWAKVGRSVGNITYLADYTIYKLLSQAGFVKETRVQQGPKGGQYKVVFFIGLGLKRKVGAESRRIYVRSLPNDQIELLPKPSVPLEIKYTTADGVEHQHFTHIEVNGTLYDRDLVATVRPIREFSTRESGPIIRAIVTFKNPEIRHQFVTAEEAVRITKQLGVNFKCQ